ncbi:MAG: methionyl-tRNA formyltransferase [Euzebya sp.]
MRIVFFGTPAPAVPSLRALHDAPDVTICAVLTNPDRPSGRGHRLSPSPVKVAALEVGLEVWQPQRPVTCLQDLVDLRVDACAVVAYGSILPQALLDAGGHGFVNLHFSLLPAWRGAAPVPASILAGDSTTGVTCFRLDAGMDTGDILLAHATRIAADETSGELTQRLAVAGAPVLVHSLRGLVDSSIALHPQDHSQATYATKIRGEDALIDWSAQATRIDRAVRAYNPMPGAHTSLDGRRIKVHRVTPQPGSGKPGQVLGHSEGRPVVACGTDAVRLDEVQPAGKPRMDGSAFAHGYRPTSLGT